jgi:hypothetical protein
MITVELNGRLGNQMFQYSICRLIANKNRINFAIPEMGQPSTEGIHIKDVFENLDLGLTDGPITNRYNEDYTVQRYDPNIFNTPNGTKLWGFFQTPKYFQGFEDVVRSWFNISLNEKSIEILKKYNPDEYCYIHLRGTDYKNHTHWFLGKDYYEKSIDYIRNFKPDIKFLIVTDDIEESKNLFPEIDCVSNDMITDFSVLLNSKHIIITNSTFSWWAAWLKNKEVVIAPNNWLNHNKPELGFYPIDIKTNNFTYL